MSARSNFVSIVCALLATVCANEIALPVPTRTATFTTLRGALDEVAARYQIRVGLECAAQDKDLQPITLDLSAKSVDTVLNQLVSQKTDYVWSFADNVYDVYPKSNPDSILDVRIHEFAIRTLSSKEAQNSVGEIPEIKQWLASHSVSRREFEVCAGSCGKSSEKLATVSLKGVTFRTLLNILADKFATVDWMVCRFGDKEEYIGIYF